MLVHADVPSCPNFLIERQAIRVIRDFCARTQVWRKDVTATLSSGDDEVTFAISGEGEVYSVAELSGTTMSWGFVPPDTLEFDEEAEEDIDLEFEVVKIPALTDVQVPEWLLDRYEDAIVSGISARLMKQVGQDWANPQMAVMRSGEYNAGVAKARIDQNKKNRTRENRIKWIRFV